MKRSAVKEYAKIVSGILFLALIVLVPVALGIAWHSMKETDTCTVTGTTATRSDEGTDYRIYTKECGVIGVGDDWFIGKFDASDRFGSVQQDKTYEITRIGWRFAPMSIFPNMLEATEVNN